MSLRKTLEGLAFTTQGLLDVDPGTFATNLPDVFAAGDIVNGGTTAVQGITEGMQAAAAISAFLAL